MTRGVWEGLRRLAADLRPASLDSLGLVAALRQHAKACSRQYGLPVRFRAVNFPKGVRLPPEVETAIYRIVQEALTNAARHARASRIGVRLELRGNTVTATVKDDGVGLDAVGGLEGGLGLTGMRERAAMLNGTLEVTSVPGKGTAVTVEVPL
jgi:signal transduction histidine kinase